MKKTIVFGVLALVLGIVLSTSMVSAYRGDYFVQGLNNDAERHAAMDAAFAELDYDAWYELMTQDGRHPKVVDMVTEDNFETFVNAHEAGISGDRETAQRLRQELGLNNSVGLKDGSGRAMSGKGIDRGSNQGQRMHNCDSSGQGRR